MACDNCSEELITTSQGPPGEPGEPGPPGTNGTNGVLDWSNFDLSCWIAEGIIEGDDDNDEITQSFIDTFCEMYQQINIAPVAVNDYRTMNQDSTIYIEVINNDNYYPDVIVTIAVAPSNGVATIEPDNKTIKYIPTSGFVGVDDFDYTINDGDATSTATVSVTVEEVISQQTIEDTVLEQLIMLLQSDDYWDLGFNIGDKIGISNINLTDFDFTNPFTAGIGKPGRYSKWAICNGNNGSEDLTEGTFRGFDSTNSDYDESAKSGGSDSVSLVRANIPAHQHKYFDAFMNAIDGSDVFSTEVDAHAVSLGVTQGTIYTSPESIQESTGDDRDAVWYDRNTSDGTDNLGNQKEVANGTGTVTAVDIRNAFKTVILIQKIS
jgi:hypothetical protein